MHGVPKGILAEPRVEFTGQYRNNEYRYTVTIPDGLTGYDSPDPSPHHGFGLVLDPQQSSLSVDGSANTLAERTPGEAANRFVRHLREDGKAIGATTIKPARLGTLPAAELVVHYTCGASRYVIVSVLALTPDRETRYEITLTTSRGRFARDRGVLDQIVRSWTYLDARRQH